METKCLGHNERLMCSLYTSSDKTKTDLRKIPKLSASFYENLKTSRDSPSLKNGSEINVDVDDLAVLEPALSKDVPYVKRRLY